MPKFGYTVQLLIAEENMILRLQMLYLLALISLAPCPADAETIRIAVASNFTAPMQAIATQFEKSTSHTVQLAFASSGKFYAQISNGAPFQVFLSADQEKPQALLEKGYMVPGTRFTYALGTLALWSIKPGISAPLQALKQQHYSKLALANPRFAPYGAAAVEVLKSLDLDKTTRTKWVQGENIAQTFQFVSSGNAELGFVSVSQIMRNGHIVRGSVWLIPENDYSPIKQDAGLLTAGKESVAAKAFLQFLRGEQATRIIQSYGYRLPKN